MNSSKIKVLARFSSLRAAVDAEKPDLSYNPERAAEYIRDIDRGNPSHPLGFKPCDLALVLEDEKAPNGRKLYFLTRCDIALLNEFSPFIGVLDDGNFTMVKDHGEVIEVISKASFPRSSYARRVIRDLQDMEPRLYATR